MAGPLRVDPTGNPTLDGDSENRVVPVTRPDDEVVTYTYDPFGMKISKDVDGTTNYYLYDGWNLTGEYNDAWAPEKTWEKGTEKM